MKDWQWIGADLCNIMAQKAMTVRDVAGVTGTSPATINRMMRGHRPDIDNYFLVANWLEGKSEPAPTHLLGGWQTMNTAPTDGTEFIAAERYDSDRVFVHVYKWEGHPNYWHSRRDGVCIRPDYQDKFLWIALPSSFATKEASDV